MNDRRTSLTRAAGVVGVFTAMSRVLGMVRDQLIAARLGTGWQASAFVIAFTLPNLFRRLFGEGALSASFLPRFTACMEKHGEPAAWRLARRVATRVAAVVGLTCAAGMLAAFLLPRAWPGQSEPARLALELGGYMLPYALPICLAGIAMGALNARHHFAAPAAAQMVLNVVMIAALVVLCPAWGGDLPGQARVLAGSVVVAGVLQLALHLPALRAQGWRPGWDWGRGDVETRAVLGALAPAAAGAAVTQLNLLLDRAMAGWASHAGPAALYFSERLIYLPLGVFAVAAGQVLLPSLARLAARDEAERVRETVGLSTRMMIFIMTPAATGLAVLAGPITALLYGFGAFDADSQARTSAAVLAYAPALVVFSMDKVWVPFFQSRHDVRTPLQAAALSLALNFALNLASLALLSEAWAHAGMAAGTVVAHSVYILWLARRARRQVGDCHGRESLACLLRCAAACAVMGLAVRLAWSGLVSILPAGKTGQAVAVLGSVAVGIGVYAALAAGLRFPEWRLIRDRRARPSPATGPDAHGA